MADSKEKDIDAGRLESMGEDSPDNIHFKIFMKRVREASETLLASSPGLQKTPLADGGPFHLVSFYAIPEIEAEVARTLLTHFLGELLASHSIEDREDALKKLITEIIISEKNARGHGTVLIPAEEIDPKATKH